MTVYAPSGHAGCYIMEPEEGAYAAFARVWATRQVRRGFRRAPRMALPTGGAGVVRLAPRRALARSNGRALWVTTGIAEISSRTPSESPVQRRCGLVGDGTASPAVKADLPPTASGHMPSA